MVKLGLDGQSSSWSSMDLLARQRLQQAGLHPLMVRSTQRFRYVTQTLRKRTANACQVNALGLLSRLSMINQALPALRGSVDPLTTWRVTLSARRASPSLGPADAVGVQGAGAGAAVRAGVRGASGSGAKAA